MLQMCPVCVTIIGDSTTPPLPPPLYLTCSRGQSGMGDLCGLDLGGVYSELASSTGGGGSSTRSTVTAPMSGCSTGGG